MRKIQKSREGQLQELICNKCGKKLSLKQGRVMEGVCSVTVRWDYFSHKDGEVHSFDLCEDCYDELIAQFCFPVSIEEERELL